MRYIALCAAELALVLAMAGSALSPAIPAAPLTACETELRAGDRDPAIRLLRKPASCRRGSVSPRRRRRRAA